ncbi:MAG TPA: alpha/beta hydrolase [Patescibacteria group bacterium]|nr:alpha/beta hydrolase [Patescibacteria group bacterium]
MLIRAIVYLLIFSLLIFAYARYIESKSVFFPSREAELNPKFMSLSFEDIYFTTPDKLKIHAWFIPADAKYTMLFCHGNAGNISTRLDKIMLFYGLRVNLFFFDYRGYGTSDGAPSEKGLYTDTRAAYEYMVNRLKIRPDRIIVYGESLGGAPAIELASKVQTAGVIVEGAFSRAADMAKRLQPFIPPFLISVKFDSLSRIGRVSVPKLFIHSKDDGIVPMDLAQKLYRAAPEPKYFTQISGPHMTAFLDSKDVYLAAIRSFIERLK